MFFSMPSILFKDLCIMHTLAYSNEHFYGCGHWFSRPPPLQFANMSTNDVSFLRLPLSLQKVKCQNSNEQKENPITLVFVEVVRLYRVDKAQIT